LLRSRGERVARQADKALRQGKEDTAASKIDKLNTLIGRYEDREHAVRPAESGY
jgi:hypothetical protein